MALSSLRRLPNKLRHRVSQSLGWSSSCPRCAITADAATSSKLQQSGRRLPKSRVSRANSRPPQGQTQYFPPPTTTGIDIARFGLLSVATLPFTIWIACFTYDYVYRVEICQEALAKYDDERISNNGTATLLLGRDKELAEVSALLDQNPSQIIVIAGGNEAGKSRFVSELLHRHHTSTDRGVTYVQLAQLVDSVSSFTQVLVNAFDLRWLSLRHQLVDVLPFAGSEILVMKERFGDRDLAQALVVLTEALKRNAAARSTSKRPRPVIIIDGVGEGPGGYWMSSNEGKLIAQRFLQWCIYVTKERQLAHIVLTGNEQLVLSLTDQNRIMRGHVKVVGLGDLSLRDASQIVRSELPDATNVEVEKITGLFGGFIHDLKGTSRDIQYRLAQEAKPVVVTSKERSTVVEEVIKARFQQQVERVIAAFAKGNDGAANGRDSGGDADKDEDTDPYLGPLKSIYSEAQASQSQQSESEKHEPSNNAGWTQLQLWYTLQRLVRSPQMAASFSELRDDIFDGDKSPILELMEEDVLGFQVDRSSDGVGWYWKVTPASPALGQAFKNLVQDKVLKERFRRIESTEEQQEQRKTIEIERARLYRERENLDLRKKSLLRTVELGRELGNDELTRTRLGRSFENIVAEEEIQDEEDRLLRKQLSSLLSTSMGDEMGDSKEANVQHRSTIGLHHASIPLRSLLKDALLDTVSSNSDDAVGDDELSRKAFNMLDETRDGKVSAADLARVVKATAGTDVDMQTAQSLVKEWDLDDDESLDYNEFVRMLVAFKKEGGKQQKRNRKESRS